MPCCASHATRRAAARLQQRAHERRERRARHRRVDVGGQRVGRAERMVGEAVGDAVGEADERQVDRRSAAQAGTYDGRDCECAGRCARKPARARWL